MLLPEKLTSTLPGMRRGKLAKMPRFSPGSVGPVTIQRVGGSSICSSVRVSRFTDGASKEGRPVRFSETSQVLK